MGGLEAVFVVIFITGIALFVAKKGTTLVVGEYPNSTLKVVMGLVVFTSLLLGLIFIILGETLNDIMRIILLVGSMIVALFSFSFLSIKIIEILTRKEIKEGSLMEFLSFGLTILLYLGSIWSLVSLIY